MDSQKVGIKRKIQECIQNDKNTLSRVEETRTVKASLVDWKDQEHPFAD